MKFLPAEIMAVLRSRRGHRNVRVLLRFFLVLVGMIVAYSVIFHYLMAREGHDHTWMTGLYWTLTVMSTLGFGDITFHTDLGRGFSIAVLLSGILFLLVLLPFTFIEFFYEPWMAAQAAARAPREVPAEIRGHVLLTNDDAVTAALVRRLDQYKIPYALVVSQLDQALLLHDLGRNVVLGELDDPDTWRRAGVERAALVATTAGDFRNTSVVSTVRGVSSEVRIISTAGTEPAVDVLKLAGCDHVLRLEEMIGQAFARRTIGGDAMAHLIGRFDEVLIAEATTHRTPLVGKTLSETRLRETVGVTVAGVWERGTFQLARPETVISNHSVLVLAGSEEHIFRYNELFCIYNVSDVPVVILGGGRVGRATARALAVRDIDYRIVESLPARVRDPERYVVGNAAEIEILREAGIEETSTVVITPHDDDLNIYLTIFCRKLRPDIQILCRATEERNVATLHRAGADIVMSYASMGGSSIVNWLQKSKVLMVAEGLDLFRVPVPEALEGKTVAESGIRDRSGCSVVAISTAQGMEVVPGPSEVIPQGADLLMIGTAESEEKFLALWPDKPKSS